jgi:serine/threonine-protein kinase
MGHHPAVVASVEKLIADGRLAEAAAALEQDGRPSRAADLYEQLWDHEAAARAARAAGDLPRAVRNALSVRDPAVVDRLLEEVERANPAVIRQCAEACEERAAWGPAARLFRAADDPGEAARCHEQMGELAQAAKLRERLGELGPATDLYRQHLLELEEAGTAPGLVAEPAYNLGRILLRSGRTEEAVPYLQQAWRTAPVEEVTRAAARAVVAALARLGFGSGARYAASLAGPSVEVRDCVEDRDLAPVQAGEEKVLAGRYSLGELLGSGGMGRVYLATDRLTERSVAVKVFTAPGGARGRDAFRRFVKEARTTGQLHHPHIVSLLDFHEEMGFMVLEYMEGGTLADRLHPRLDVPTARAVTLQILSGLAAAHQRGVVHRDIKPSNIFFTTAGAAKLGDFGVAHLQDAGQTQTGAFIGTLAFMAPEQIKGEPVTFATDIYALGVTLFQALTGQLPFTHPDLVTKHLTAPPPPPSSVLPGLPPACDDAVLRCLAKEPAGRFESLDSLRRAVERFPTQEEARRPGERTEARHPAQKRRASDRRFTAESVLVDEGPLQVQEVQDTHLGRPALLVRIAPGERRAALLQLLGVAARGGTVALQRVLLLDRDKGQALLETPAGTEAPPMPPPDGLAALRLAERLGRALAPLHSAGLVHGRVTADQITQVEPASPTLSLIGALRAHAAGPLYTDPAAEVARVLELLGLAREPDLEGGAALAQWARERRERLVAEERDRRRQALVARLLGG